MILFSLYAYIQHDIKKRETETARTLDRWQKLSNEQAKQTSTRSGLTCVNASVSGPGSFSSPRVPEVCRTAGRISDIELTFSTFGLSSPPGSRSWLSRKWKRPDYAWLRRMMRSDGSFGGSLTGFKRPSFRSSVLMEM